MKRFFLFAGVILTLVQVQASSISDSLFNQVNQGIQFKMGDNPDFVLKLGFNAQFWARAMQMNDLTHNLNGNTVNYDSDFLLRRASMVGALKLNRFTFFMHLASTIQTQNNSINKTSPASVNLYFYDVWGSYQCISEKLILGAGLNMYNGLTRLSSSSSMRTLTLDVPVITSPNITSSEQSARQLSFFMTGELGKINYRFALANPFEASNVPEIPTPEVLYHNTTTNFNYKAYVAFQFFETERASTPFRSGTYLGTKKIANLGIGFDITPNAMIQFDAALKPTKFDKTHWAVDLFIDYPFANKSALTLYAAQLFLNYGPKFLQAFGTADIYTQGTAEYQFGTGLAQLLQIGYLLPSTHKANRWQPFYELTIRNFDGLTGKLYHHNLGINYLVIEHKIKATLQYENRPVYNKLNLLERKNMLICKLQFSI
jgi:hypothetical protein